MSTRKLDSFTRINADQRLDTPSILLKQEHAQLILVESNYLLPLFKEPLIILFI